MADSDWEWLLRNPIIDLMREQDSLLRSIQDSLAVHQRVLEQISSGSVLDFLRQHEHALAEIREKSLGFLAQANQLSGFIDSQAMRALSDNRPRLDQLAAASSAFGHLDEANQAFSRMVASPDWAECVRQSAQVHPGWKLELAALNSLPPATALETLFSSEIASLAELSATAERALSVLPLDQLSESFGQRFSDDLNLFMRAYGNLIGELESNPTRLTAYSPVVTRTPPREVALTAWTLDAVWSREDEPTERRQLPPVDPDAVLDRLPSSWVERYLPLLNGAKAAVRSDNPDRVRHVTTSLRELTNHLLRDLAPDEEVMKWDTDGEHLHEGGPTRRGRVLFLCRNLGSGSFQTFVDRDVAAVLELIQLLHSGVHKLEAGYTELQLRTMVRRVEWLVLFLFDLKDDGA